MWVEKRKKMELSSQNASQCDSHLRTSLGISAKLYQQDLKFVRKKGLFHYSDVIWLQDVQPTDVIIRNLCFYHVAASWMFVFFAAHSSGIPYADISETSG